MMGHLVFADGFHLHGNIKAAAFYSPAISNGGAKAIATLLYVGEEAGELEKPMKDACKALFK